MVNFIIRFNLVPAVLLYCCIYSFSFNPEQLPCQLVVSGSFGVFFVYNVHRLIKLQTGRYSNQSFIETDVRSHFNAYLFVVTISFLVAGITGYQLFLTHWKSLLSAALIGSCYSLPIFPYKSGFRSLREIPLLKGVAVAGVWCFITSIFPVYLLLGNFIWKVPGLYVFWLARFLVFYIITGLSDIRDIHVDPPNLKTIPHRLGVQKAIWFYLLLLLIVMLLNGCCYWKGLIDTDKLTAYLLSNVLLGILILKSKHHQPSWFYAILVDGVLIVQFFWLLVVGG